MNWFVYHCSVILSYFVSGTATINPWFKITMPRFQPSGGLTDHFVSQKKRRDQALPSPGAQPRKSSMTMLYSCACITTQAQVCLEIRISKIKNSAFEDQKDAVMKTAAAFCVPARADLFLSFLRLLCEYFSWRMLPNSTRLSGYLFNAQAALV